MKGTPGRVHPVLGWGTPQPGQDGGGGTPGPPSWDGVPPDWTTGALATRRAVCLLRSRRSIFLSSWCFFCSVHYQPTRTLVCMMITKKEIFGGSITHHYITKNGDPEDRRLIPVKTVSWSKTEGGTKGPVRITYRFSVPRQVCTVFRNA